MHVAKAALILVGALLIGALMWLSVAADWFALWHGAGWWALVVVAFPAFIAFGVWRGWGDGYHGPE